MILALKFIGAFALLFLLSAPAFSQNTKGDRPPVKNQRQVRETKAKSYKKKEKGRTRDIANRRLRTKSQSSANRANAQYPRPSPYPKQNKKQLEKSARPLGRVFSQPPREGRTQAWKGDVSGYHIRKVKPGRNDAARSNVFPQKNNDYVKGYSKRPKGEKPKVYTRNIQGGRVGQNKPKNKERAWQGRPDKGPIRNQSISGSVNNFHPQDGPYVAYRKKLTQKENPVSNREELATIRNLSRKPTGAAKGGIYPASESKAFRQRGKKNVYWGKFSKKERPFTSDLTGGPLRTRNYKTMPAGLVGRDTLKFFGKKPFGDRSSRLGAGGYITATGKGQRGWKGDIARFRLRKSAKGRKEVAGEFVFPRQLSISRAGERVGSPIQGGGFRTGSKRGEKAQLKSVPGIIYGNRIGGGVKSKIRPGFSIQGAGYSGNLKRSSVRGFSTDGVNYSGKIKRSSVRGFSTDGVNYSGNIKSSSVRGFSTDGVNYSGKIKRSSVRGFSTDGVNYSGNIKSSSVRGFSTDGVNYSGKIKRSSIRGFSTAGVNYSGKIKRSSVRGFSTAGVNYSGNIKSSSVRGFSTDGVNYSGNIKSRRPAKGGGSVSGNLWNNDNNPIVGKISFNRAGGNYAGNIKGKRPEKGGESVSGVLWNNNNQAINGRPPLTDGGVGFAGNIKAKRPEKGGGSVSGTLWNNDNQAIAGRPPLSQDGDYSGKIALSKFKKNYIQNPNSSKESLKKRRPSEFTYAVAGLQVKVLEKDYKKKPYANKYALKGVAPSKSSLKASEYAKGMKRIWDYEHNPNSAAAALKGIAPSKAIARIGDYQGNIKMHKYSDSRLHPDAQFAHGYRDNVKEERTLLMNVKLLWAKLFRKSETQPENLKEKIHRPRYDKREKGMWNE